MQKIDKAINTILSKKYKTWVDKLEKEAKQHPESRTYYDDVVMNLYKCQKGVCAYTEMHICIPELYYETNWVDGKYKIPEGEAYSRLDHLGELEHFDSNLKEEKYWLWDNLFMIHARINSIKSDKNVVGYLKPDLTNYAPETYFDYDEDTHRYIPNTDIEDPQQIAEIQYMIDFVLCLNHGVVKNDRRDFINDIKLKQKNGNKYTIDRFFTAVSWCI